jgi:NAD(P)-dependent dehydrogenase (short-subunit alcohol dehydrogenase family)
MKHVLIIGATRGIGRAITTAFLDGGYAVSVISRRKNPEPGNSSSGVSQWTVDITDARRRSRILDHIIRERGRLTHLVFAQRYRGAADDWSGEVETSLTATKDIIDHLANAFGNAPEKSIAMVSSIASGLIADEQPLSYHVAKAGLVQMARYYAVVLGAKGIRVNSVSPGVVLKDEARDFYRRNKKLRDLYKTILPSGRMITAAEIAQVVVFLCGPKAISINGQNIIADGGLSLQWQESLTRRATMKHLAITRRRRRS